MPVEQIRQFAQMFTNLTRDQQIEFERALVELEDSGATTSLSQTLDLLVRKPDQFMPIPQVVVTRSVRGGLLQWQPLPDQKISFFEIDISDVSNFAAFNTVTTFGNQLSINGITNTKYFRVRGVRKDGTTGQYSDVVSITPRVFDVAVRFQETFYSRIPKGSNPPTDSPFYTVARIKYTPTDVDAKSMILGFVTLFADPNVMIYGLDDLKIKVRVEEFYVVGGGSEVSEYWAASTGEYFGSYSVGPFAVPHPNTEGQVLEIKLQVQDGTQQTSNPCTEVLWAWLASYEIGLS